MGGGDQQLVDVVEIVLGGCPGEHGVVVFGGIVGQVKIITDRFVRFISHRPS
jgi:hypothetical protein